jgi:glycosyltransferase involved in cell wall biosynthesis
MIAEVFSRRRHPAARGVAPEIAEVRAEAAYEAAYQPRPLVTVRIATFNRADLLVERALASVRRQTYDRWEAVVVGDACTDGTARKVAALGDPRIRFENLPVHGPYPRSPRARWMVAGTGPMNRGLELARGQWIAALDDDDEWEPDHLAVLVDEALRTGAEVVYGRHRVRDAVKGRLLGVEVGSWPPRRGTFAFQDALCHSGLRAFRYDPEAFTLGEPADWNLARRLLEAGALFAYVDRVVMTAHYTPRHLGGRFWLKRTALRHGYASG